jgi:uncharacterized membrane protein YeaQ/YmgE (transglycosylase-associated protein family)
LREPYAATLEDAMNETYGILGNPSVGFFMMLIIGAIAGWIAEKVTNSDHGILTNILVGVCGALVGGKLAELLEIPVFGFFRGLAAAIIGAIIVLYLWRMIQKARQ